VRDFVLNVIYTGGTVRCLSILLWSLLDHSDCHFRLVANACSPAEIGFLRRLAAHSPRLSYLVLPSRKVMPHGLALNYLQAGTHAERFGFIDSDIFATEDLPHRNFEMLTGRRVCLCYPSTLISSSNDAELVNIEGVSCTYMSVFDNRALTDFIQSTGIGFDKYDFEVIPREYQERLIAMGARMLRYDTGQLLCHLMLGPNDSPLIVEVPQLMHIGGFSRTIFNEQRAVVNKKGLRYRMRMHWLNVKESLFKKPHVRRGQINWTEAERAAKAIQTQRKRAVSHYVDSLFEALIANRPAPAPPHIGEPGIDAKLRAAIREIVALAERHGERHFRHIGREFYEQSPGQAWRGPLLAKLDGDAKF
jgi:hypothetical protein